MKSILYYLCTITCLLFCLKPAAQNFRMVKDINDATDANPYGGNYSDSGVFSNTYFILNGISYFGASDGLHGTELWRSDGTSSGTYMLKDINTGSLNSNPTFFASIKNELFFVANNTEYGLELWKSDGTFNGTTILKDINFGMASAYPYQVFSSGNHIFFSIQNVSGQRVNQFWKSDGTEAGTIMIGNSTDSSSYTLNATKVGKDICFFIPTSSEGLQLWKTNKLQDSVLKVKDIADEYFTESVISNGKTLYFGCNGSFGSSLWKSDGTSDGTVMIDNNINPSNFVFFDTSLIFTSFSSNINLYKTDGSLGGSHSFFSTTGQLSNIVTANNSLFFSNTTESGGESLFKSDGTRSGTILVKQLDSVYFPMSYILTSISDKIYFPGYTQTHGTEFWKSDGTTIGTIEIKDIDEGAVSSTPGYFTLLNNKIIFSATDEQHGNELWVMDTLSNNPSLLKDINTTYTANADPSHFTILDNKLLFSAYNNAHGNELWKSNGTDQGTVLVKDINKASLYGTQRFYSVLPYFKAGDKAYFIGITSLYGQELWQTNGNSSSTSMIKDLSPGIENSGLNYYPGNSSQFADVNGRLYYTGYQSAYPTRFLYSTIGSNGIINLIASTYSYFNNLTTFRNQLCYTVNYPAELWITDSIASTNRRIINAKPDGRNSLFTYKNQLYFGSDNGYTWRTDGTNENTKLFKEIRPDPYYYTYNSDIDFNYIDGYVSANSELNGILYFAASNAFYGSELWKTDGTEQGTSLVKDINTGTADAQLGSFVTVNNILYFLANDGIHGRELWRTDGTYEGTVLVKDITTGIASSEILSLTAIQNKITFLLYNATDKSFRLWQSDGTESGTNEVTDNSLNNIQIVPPLRVINNQIYFAATTIENGNELWVGTLDGVLATQLFNFSGNLINNNDAQLKWITADEQNLSYFNLQRSIDGIHFTTIAKLFSKDNATEKINYQYSDKNIDALNSKNIYYRLETINDDGKSSLSNIVLLQLKPNSLVVSIKPNPSRSNFEIQLNQVQTSQQVHIQIINSSGNTILSDNKNMNAGNNVLSYRVSSWPAGIYIIKISLIDGSFKEVKLIKQ